MPKFFITTSRATWVDYVHWVEAPDAATARRMAEGEEAEVNGGYLGHSLDEEVCDTSDEIEVTETEPVVQFPNGPTHWHVRRFLKEVLPWLIQAEDLSDDRENVAELRILQRAAREFLREMGVDA